jgi:hypothetical protein
MQVIHSLSFQGYAHLPLICCYKFIPWVGTLSAGMSTFSLSLTGTLSSGITGTLWAGLYIQNHELNQQLALINQLDDDEKNALVRIINSMLTKKRKKDLLDGKIKLAV